jgi:hypothetical protein
MLTFLKFPCGNTAGTLLVKYKWKFCCSTRNRVEGVLLMIAVHISVFHNDFVMYWILVLCFPCFCIQTSK